ANITRDRIFSKGLKLELRVLIDPLQINKYQNVTENHYEDSSKPDIVTFIINVTNSHIIRPIKRDLEIRMEDECHPYRNSDIQSLSLCNS
ncbi:hypothetical protein GIB67_042319, partial [Kingdonia uniflora]